MVAFSAGWCLRASIAAFAKNGRYDSLTPSRDRKSPFTSSRSRAMLVTSTSTTWVSWAEVCGESRSEEHTSELQTLMRISYAVFCLKKKIKRQETTEQNT